ARVYGADMAGAALGCLGGLWLLDLVSGPTAMLWIAWLFALASLFFSRSVVRGESQTRMPLAFVLTRAVAIVVGLAIFAAANSLSDNGIQLLAAKGRSEALNGHKLFERWNSISRITVFDEGQGIPKLWGPSVDAPIERTINQRLTQIDGLA